MHCQMKAQELRPLISSYIIVKDVTIQNYSMNELEKAQIPPRINYDQKMSTNLVLKHFYNLN